jgi:hypothetical protein
MSQPEFKATQTITFKAVQFDGTETTKIIYHETFSEVFEAFKDFMVGIGYSETTITKYFGEEE